LSVENPEGMFNRRMSEADLAHAILRARGTPLYFLDLFEQVMTIKELSGKDREHIMAGIHTEINLDGRFVHVGKGIWGLREWMPGRVSNRENYGEDAEN